jgi:hypothetical protein
MPRNINSRFDLQKKRGRRTYITFAVALLVGLTVMAVVAAYRGH